MQRLVKPSYETYIGILVRRVPMCESFTEANPKLVTTVSGSDVQVGGLASYDNPPHNFCP